MAERDPMAAELGSSVAAARRGASREVPVMGVCPWAVVAWAVVGVLVLLTGCASDDAAPVDGTATSDLAPASAPEPPAPGEPGTGSVVVGSTAHPFEVTGCRLEPDPTEPEAARALLIVSGAGTTPRGDAFTVEVQRFATTLGEVTTFTDTITYEDPARILQAQRIEVGGQVTDLRDPSASTALLRPRADGVSGAGLAGAPGDDADDEGVVGLALDATCP